MVDFNEEFETWLRKRRRDLETENRLAASIREVWTEGSSRERDDVLALIYMRRERAAYDLFIEALLGEDAKLAESTLPMLWSLLSAGEHFGPELRDAVDEHVRRFPEDAVLGNPILRDLDNPPAAPEPASFAGLFESWFYHGNRDNAELESSLRNLYREAWDRGSLRDREAVIKFLAWVDLLESSGILLAALRSDDERIATDAVANLRTLCSESHQLGPEVRDALESYIPRFPNEGGSIGLSEGLLEMFDQNMNPS